MYRAGWTSALSCAALRKWSLDPGAEDGGVLGVEGWELGRGADMVGGLEVGEREEREGRKEG